MITTNNVTQSSDENHAIEEINSIYEYVRNQRPNINQFTGLLPLIQDFEGWYQALEESWKQGVNLGVISTRHIVSLADLNEAKRKREAINSVMGQHIPDDYVPPDSPQTPPVKPEQAGLFPNFDMGGVVTVAGIGLGGLLLYKLLSK